MIRAGQMMAHISSRAAGIWTVVAGMSEALNQRDSIGATVLGLVAEDTPDILENYNGAPAVTASVVGPHAFGYAPSLRQALYDADLDILHAHGIWMYMSKLGRDWARRTGKPHIVSTHGMLDPWALANSRWKKQLVEIWFEQSHLREASCLHALCTAELEAIRRYGLSNPVCVIPNGVDLPQGPVADPPPWDEETIGERVLLYLGRIHPKKGLPLLLRSFAKAERSANWSLVIAGWDQGDHETELRELVNSLGIEHNVQFIGPLRGAEKASAMYNADAFVLPSLSEGLPMTVLEAWSYGLPVLMTADCHLPEGAATGAAIEVAATSEGLANGLRQLFEMSTDERREMGRRGLALVNERYTWPQVAERMHGVYEWLLGSGARPEEVDTISR